MTRLRGIAILAVMTAMPVYAALTGPRWAVAGIAGIVGLAWWAILLIVASDAQLEAPTLADIHGDAARPAKPTGPRQHVAGGDGPFGPWPTRSRITRQDDPGTGNVRVTIELVARDLMSVDNLDHLTSALQHLEAALPPTTRAEPGVAHGFHRPRPVT
jgi:hypothetical protein